MKIPVTRHDETIPSGVLFDLGDTVIRDAAFDPGNANRFLFSTASNPRGVTYEDLAEYSETLTRELCPRKDLGQIELPWIAFNRILLDYFGLKLPVTFEQAESEFFRRACNWELLPGITDLLFELDSIGIPAGIVSNTVFSGTLVRNELERIGIAHFFTCILTSSDYGLRKPDPELFKVAASLLDRKTADCWFIGDDFSLDVIGARAAGMKAFQFTGSTGKANGRPGETITDWFSFGKVVSAWRPDRERTSSGLKPRLRLHGRERDGYGPPPSSRRS